MSLRDSRGRKGNCRESRRGGACSPGNLKKYSLFNAISCVLKLVLCMEQVTNKKENIRNVDETKLKQEHCSTFK